MPYNTSISAIMNENPFFIEITDSVKKAEELMETENISHIPVVEQNKFIGLITKESLNEYQKKKMYDPDDAEEEQNLITDYRHLLDKNVHLIYSDDSLLKALNIIAKYKVNFLVVVDWNHNLIGVVNWYDILLFFHKKLSEEK